MFKTCILVFALVWSVQSFAESKTAAKIDCKKYPTCGIVNTMDNKACKAGTNTTCYSISECPQAICVNEKEICKLKCGSKNCLTMESYPAQISCN